MIKGKEYKYGDNRKILKRLQQFCVLWGTCVICNDASKKQQFPATLD